MCGRRRLCVHKNGSRVAIEITGYFEGLPHEKYVSPSIAYDWRKVFEAMKARKVFIEKKGVCELMPIRLGSFKFSAVETHTTIYKCSTSP